MSGHALPDDPARWPENPYELLGVRPGTGARELRRAYTRLIRTFKPEQFPEQFRRIREAYDRLLPYAEMFGRVSDAPAEESERPPPAHAEEAPPRPALGDAATAPEPQWPRQAPAPRLEDELDALWEAAVAGKPADAYRRLVQLSYQHEGKTDLYLRLYWLLTLAPEVGGRDVPADWLARGLLATGLAGPLRELYRQEVEAAPAEAFTDRFASLLAAPAAPGLLVDLAEWRFKAALRLGKWDGLDDDQLRRLGERLRSEDDRLWLRLLFALADELAWVREGPAGVAMRNCREEIQSYEHLATSGGAEFDRFDWLWAAATGWHDLRRSRAVPAELLELLRLSWSRPFAEAQPLLEEVLAKIDRNPRQWLVYFDNVQSRGAGTLALFGQLLDQREADGVKGGDLLSAGSLLSRFVMAFLGGAGAAGYSNCRGKFLDWCLREYIDPEVAAGAARSLDGDWAAAGAEFGKAVSADWPLRYVCKACQLFRA
jgi:hypothetical protein